MIKENIQNRKTSTMSEKNYSKLRELPCKDGEKCLQIDEDIKMIEHTFKQPEQYVLGVMNSYIHNEDDPSCEDLPHDCRGYSALHLAAEKNLLFVAEKLLENGFNPLTPGCKDNTCKLALHVAIEMGFDEMAALIIRHMKAADVRDLFLNNPENSEFMKCKRLGKTNEETLDVFSVNYLIQRNCVFVKTIKAVFDSLKDVHGNRLCTVYVKLLEEDNKGLEPTKEGFNANHHTVFHNLTNAQKEVANHPVIGMLIDHKWNAWGRRKFVSVFFNYLVSLFFLTFAIATGVMADDVRTYDTPVQRARAFFEIAICILAFHRLMIEVLQMKRHMLDYWKQFFNWIELLSTVCIFIVVLLRYTTEKAHWLVLAVAYMLWVLRIFKYADVWSPTGAYAESLRQILTNNVVPFSLLFVVVNVAFGGVFLLILKLEDKLNTHDETSTMYGIWFVGLRTMIEAGPIVEYTGSDGYGPASTIVMLVFMATIIVVLLNILIAQMSDTYSKIQDDAVKSVRANRVAIPTRLERNEWLILTYLVEQLCQSQSRCDCIRFEPNKWKKVVMSYRKKHYQPVFQDVDLKSQSFSTQLEDMQEQIQQLKTLQMQTDLKAQTIKSRLRLLDDKMEMIQDIKYILEKRNLQDYENESEIPYESDSHASWTSLSDSDMNSSPDRKCSSEFEFDNVSNLEERELSGNGIADQQLGIETTV